MYQVKFKASINGYKPLTQTGVFVPKGATCKKEKIEKQVLDFITPQLQKQVTEGTTVDVKIISIKKIPTAFICTEDK